MYIAIEGVIGVGKTTLARLIHKAFQADLLMEVFEEIPLLAISTQIASAMHFKPKSFSY